MKDLNSRDRVFAATLAAAAGFVDAAGFLMTSGYFVSFMSGNTTRLGAGLIRNVSEAAMAGGLVLAFIAGVICGATVRRLGLSRPELIVLLLISVALFLCGGLALHGWTYGCAALLAGAMGSQNTIFASDGQVRVALTYMTGTLVKLGKALAGRLFGEPGHAWVPYLVHWSALISGAIAGASAYVAFGAAALLIAGTGFAVLAAASLAVFPSREGRAAEDGGPPSS